jgi:replicative DNA helicase
MIDPEDLIACPEAERALLGCALLAPAQAAQILAGVDRDDFTDTRCQAVHQAMRALVDAGAPPDPVVVLGYLRANGLAPSIARSRDPGAWLHDLAEAAPTPSSSGHYRRILLEHTYRRAIAAAAVRWAQVAHTEPLLDCDQALDELHAAAVTARGRLRRGHAALTAISGGVAE